MRNAEVDRLEKECLTFCRYLIGRDPDRDLAATYRHYHDVLETRLRTPSDGFDGFLLSVARQSPLLAQPADAYARLFRPRALLRKKLILLLAILESRHPWHGHVDGVDAVGGCRMAFRVALSLLIAGVSLTLGVLCLAPVQAAYALGKWRRERRQANSVAAAAPDGPRPAPPPVARIEERVVA